MKVIGYILREWRNSLRQKPWIVLRQERPRGWFQASVETPIGEYATEKEAEAAIQADVEAYAVDHWRDKHGFQESRW